MKKKLLFVITKSNWGGAQRYVYDLATNLPEYDVAVAYGGEGELVRRLQEKHARLIPIPGMVRNVTASKDTQAFFELIKIFRRERPDIVHLNSSKAGALGALAARIARVPSIVFTVHGWPSNEPVSPLSKLFRWSASLATLLLCDKVMTVSHFAMMHAPLGIKTTPVHNGIEEPNFVPRDEAREFIAELAGIPKDALWMGTLAELHPNKGIDILIAALTSVPIGSYAIVMGEGVQRQYLEQLIATHNLGDRIKLVGFVRDAASYLKAFDLFVLPSRTEALGYVIIEAGFAGLPVVATTVGGIPEVVDDQLTGILVPPYDAQDLAAALNEMIESPNTRARYGAALQEKVRRYFGLRGMVKKTIEVYES